MAYYNIENCKTNSISNRLIGFFKWNELGIRTMESLTEIMKYKEQVANFLEKQEAEMLTEWYKNIKVNDIDPYKDTIKNNGIEMYQFIIKGLFGKLSKDSIIELADKVANERLISKINIGDFLYNINLGRNIVIRKIFEIDIPLEYLKANINEINVQIDTFSYRAVTKYTNLQNKVIEEKNTVISENHKDKLVLLGQISSSFVHEFRNPLTAVIGFTKLLKKENPHLKYLDIIDYELQQLNFRITQFLHTSKGGELSSEKTEKISIIKLVDEILQLTYASIVDASIVVDVEVSSAFEIYGNRDGLKQVMLNLFINSIDALKDKDQPKILQVKTSVEDDELIITVSNNGPIIEKEYIESIFEPFFTTKELGTGIGLYVCKNIIESYDGILKCESNEEQTSFSIHFNKHKHLFRPNE